MTTKTTHMFDTILIPNSEIETSGWNKYVYRVYTPAILNDTVCAAMCVFDAYNDKAYSPYKRCFFWVADSTNCYLGRLEEETSLLASPVIGDMSIKKSEYRQTQNVQGGGHTDQTIKEKWDGKSQ
jgi:hypothetical protein